MHIKDIIESCKDCELNYGVDHKVISKGAYNAKCMIIGEA